MIYQWKDASYIKVDATVAGRMCEELEATVGLSAKTLLDANRADDAPLHNEFEWNDNVAAEKYRLNQARHIINCLVVTRDSTEPQRMFFNIEKSDSQYFSVDAIMRRTDTREKLLKMALGELHAFSVKYAALEELAKVFEAIDSVSDASNEGGA